MVLPKKGHMAIIMYQGVSIGYSESVRVDLTRNVDPFYEHGDPRPVQLVEGNEEVTGSMSRAWVDWQLLNCILVSGTGSLPSNLDLYIKLRGGELDNLYLSDVTIRDTSLDIPQDGFLMQDIDFRAIRWTKAASGS